MLRQISAVLNDDQGQGLAEYGLILALIAVVCIAAITLLGTNINSTLSKVAQDV